MGLQSTCTQICMKVKVHFKYFCLKQMNLNIELHQVYLLQSEAHENKTLMFMCEYFGRHGRIKH